MQPSEADARAWYKEAKTSVDTIEAKLGEGVKSLPQFVGKFECDVTVEDVKDRVKVPGMEALVRDTECTSLEIKWHEANSEHRKAFVKEVLLPLLDTPGLVGLRLKMRRLIPARKDEPVQDFHTFGTFHANKAGSTAPEQGIVLDDRNIGWGLGQLACGKEQSNWEGADGYQRQFDVHWTHEVHGVQFEIKAHFMPDVTPTREWRENCYYN